LEQFVRESVSEKVSLLCTDQWTGYRNLHHDFPHAIIDHSRMQYVVGAVHTNTIEGFWSIFKRGVVGTFHKISAKYLPLFALQSSSSGTTIAGTTTFSGPRSADASKRTQMVVAMVAAHRDRFRCAAGDGRINVCCVV
jgi:hypothetical protein